VSCNLKTEEICYDETYTKAVSCSLISDGGCPCPQGLERCEADLENGCVGYCTDICCDWINEYACHDLKVCAKIEDGCPCPEGRVECFPGDGVCSDSCCDLSTEELCYGSNDTSFCAPVSLSRMFRRIHQILFSTHLTLHALHRKPMEAAHVRVVKRGVMQVSFFGCKDDNKIQHVCSKYLCPDLANNYVGYCTMDCCDSKTQHFCYEYDDGDSKPYTNQYCKAVRQFVTITPSQSTFS
jgi:hypothetical protein